MQSARMKINSMAYLLTIGLLISACTPSQAEFAKADFGAYPENAQNTVDKWLDRTLIDPDSRKVEFMSGPDRYYWGYSNPRYGYLVCGTVNARNRMGGYVGRAPFWALVRGNSVVSGDMKEAGDTLWIAPPPCQRG